MKVRLISPFDDAEQIWTRPRRAGASDGRSSGSCRRETGSEEFMAGITIFEPGEASSYHVHPESEEINLVLSGSGLVVSEGEEAEFGPGHAMWVPKGVYHQHKNTSTSR